MKTISLFFLIILLFVAVACESTGNSQQAQVLEQTRNREDVYIPSYDVEFDNYNERQRRADDPNTILWCTFFPDTVGQEVFTLAIRGKLTSSGKSPFPSEQRSGTSGYYNPDLPGPDAMFGHSSEYRYGFTPAGVYVDFTDLPSFCTTSPFIWQMNETRVMIQVDESAAQLSEQAYDALNEGDGVAAEHILSGLENFDDDE